MSEKKVTCENIINMRVEDLKRIIENLPDDMDVIIPVITEDDANNILAFRHVRTAGVLSNPKEDEPALCLNAAADGKDIRSQVDMSCEETKCVWVLF